MHNSGVSTPFTAPGPGAWELETTHLSRPISRWLGDIMPEAITAGFRAGTAKYGILLDCMEFAIVNRFVYTCARGVAAPKDAQGPPPKLIFKILLRVHPELRKRVKRSAEVFATKAWREDVERWDREWKPALVKRFEQLQKIDLRRLETAALIAHLAACRDEVRDAIWLHHRLNPVAMTAIGDLLVHVRDWVGMPASEVLPLMRGASAVSLGATTELQRVVRELAPRDDLKMLLAGSDPGATLEALSSDKSSAGAAVRDYIDAAGIRITAGYDVADLSMGEMPELLVDTIRAALSGSSEAGADTLAADIARVRAKIPAQHREKFDELLSEARLTYRMRDERGYMNDAWITGIARRAILEAGERLVASGRLHDPTHAVELTPGELVAALRGETAPSADEAAEHFRYRTTHTTDDAPANLGLKPSPPPPSEWLPAPAARLARVVETVLGEMFARHEGVSRGEQAISGFPASPGEITGVARVIKDPTEMSKVRPGEVLVTRSTGPSYNALLPLIRGIVTDRGGTLSHAALVAREYGIPAVVGCGNATEVIPNGAMVRIDGSTGRVHIVS